ncbi:hypothetical protein COW36_05425 [bacterium (Candidatus Blackallbacteria) CG17_big_fil_post_rev_8_21_14_2_50_48_46]|uniref:TVP38/TMEM64 family membrane protein n=1 Tax=bacterium (Candidatus Blackallbacteria) CG17_big_fil_post_rev_8_21_14_2_50_48_46 TaxID=2014261 RepID=A0A2M7G7Z3_9BACT|nr:MAG: hypothetical protein COW64_21020 [bacterium (Candidatus Blackallbacteria) CG18_big_fil_WC_8_21_14_2_50_49_26]PIW18209.1 MAG: hypothetical protein COW36_05425 [bacterium (Candidatus Blackallbacteria) CG17_big_fil_post_rev_8_21_14_2_50_48_46]PIW50640.1 MAG: hypothetical protein COW20_01690 [bacterium (Candidatus Blackallbacteria) CG13_big_fil_rev_8_21_14_2_50_49_14]
MSELKTAKRHAFKKWAKPAVFLAVLVLLFISARFLGLDKKLAELQTWIQSLGTLGPIVFVALYALATVLAIPGSALTLAGGALFGSSTGLICVSLGSTLGAALCFLIARYLARNTLEQSFENNPLFQKLDALTEKQGAMIVAITRLVPLFPFNLLNYGFGLTKVPFLTYLFWSWLCMLPGTLLYVVGSDALTQALAKGQIPWPLVGLVILMLMLISLIARKAQKKLEEASS